MREKAKSSSGLPGWRMLVLVLLLALGAGIAAGGVFTALMASNSVAQTDPTPRTIKVSAEKFLGERSLPLQLPSNTQWEATAPAAGVLRMSACAADTPINSGQLAFIIGDTPVIALSTAQPFYRDFTPGIRGDDVTALQQELQRLGYYAPAPTGIYDYATVQAVRALRTQLGVDARASELPLTQLLWLPAPQLVPQQCTAQLGASLAEGDKLFSTTLAPASLRVKIPQGVTAAGRVLIAGEATLPLPEDGVITDPAFIQAVQALPQYANALKDKQEMQLSSRLAEPVTAFAVPVSALYRVNGDTACVVAGGKPQAVQIVGSAYGNTMVLSDKPLGRVLLDPGTDAKSCV